MAADKITYGDKSQGQVSGFPTNQKWTFGDANEVKDVVNANANDIDQNALDISTNTSNIATNTALSVTNRIIVNQSNVATTLGGVIDPTKGYFIDGSIDMGTVVCTVPLGGIDLMGDGANVSKLSSSENAYTMFVSDGGNAGNFIHSGIEISVTGAGSKVYDLISASGFSSFSANSIIWLDCSSLGSIEKYAQGLEVSTIREGGQPELELIGNWERGYVISNSQAFLLVDGSYSIYKAGLAFVMNGRFRSNQNIDLPTSASFIDFAPANFVTPSTLQLIDCLMTRGGILDASDTNITPNIAPSDLVSLWIANNGLGDTHVGGTNTITAEIETTINTQNVYEDLEGTFTTSGLQHFDSPSNGQLRHLGTSPRDYKITAHLDIDGGSNDELQISIARWDDSASSFSEISSQIRVVNNFQGGRDVAFFNIIVNTILDQNDFIKIQVRNLSDTSNVTAELEGYYFVEER